MVKKISSLKEQTVKKKKEKNYACALAHGLSCGVIIAEVIVTKPFSSFLIFFVLKHFFTNPCNHIVGSSVYDEAPSMDPILALAISQTNIKFQIESI